MIGATIAPSDPPLYEIAMPRACFDGGRESIAVRKPPGNVAPSPKPSSARATAKPMKPPMNACEALAKVHNPTANNMPIRSPK